MALRLLARLFVARSSQISSG